MADNLTKEQRSWNMSQIRSKDTKPEMTVRSLLHHMGYRFRLHRKDLPGCPDIVLAKYKTAIFVHGCFWHRHKGCNRCTFPATNREYWAGRFKRNIEKDVIHERKLKEDGWNVLTIWECECKNTELLEEKIRAYFSKIRRNG